jgi:HAD superfamily hydrolase (TIGR01509 family)
VHAVVFDLDGVLIDSEQLWDAARRDLAASAGRAWPDGATRAMQGMSTAEWSTYLATTVGILSPSPLIAERVIDAMARRYAVAVPFMPGAVDAVERMASRWPLGLASSSPRRLIDMVLSSSPLGPLFEVTVSTEEVAAGKPSPVVYEDVVRRLGADPAQTVAIEDSSNGLRSAHAAGLIVIAVPNAAYPPAPEALALADAILPSLDALVPSLVDRLLESSDRPH